MSCRTGFKENESPGSFCVARAIDPGVSLDKRLDSSAPAMLTSLETRSPLLSDVPPGQKRKYRVCAPEELEKVARGAAKRNPGTEKCRTNLPRRGSRNVLSPEQ